MLPTPVLPTAEGWFARQSRDCGITQLYEPHVVPLDRSNIWAVQGRDRDLVLDFGVGVSVGDLRAELADLIRKPVIAVARHAHCDHTGSFSSSMVGCCIPPKLTIPLRRHCATWAPL